MQITRTLECVSGARCVDGGVVCLAIGLQLSTIRIEHVLISYCESLVYVCE